jgi:hypothetical protein
LFECVFVSAGKCSPSRCLAAAVTSGSIIPVFRLHVTLHSTLVERGGFCAVRIVSNTQDVVKVISSS